MFGYFSHIARKKGLERLMLEGMVHGKRSSRLHKMRWVDEATRRTWLNAGKSFGQQGRHHHDPSVSLS